MNPLKPVRFYGSSLPRPRFVDDVLETPRKCPQPAVNEALLEWAKEANWRMGGLSFARKRMQGKIEGRLSKLKDLEDEDDEKENKAPKKARASPDSASKKFSPRSTRRKGNSVGIKGRHGKGAMETPLVVVKRPASVPVLGEWGEEDGPTPRRVSPRLHASNLPKPTSSSPPESADVSPPSVSIEFPIRRRQVERALPDIEDSDSDIHFEEFSRSKTQPLKSKRVSVRRSFKDFALAPESL